MHDPRTSSALRHLVNLTSDPPPSRWCWAVSRIDTKGRLTLSAAAIDVLGLASLAMRWHGLALLVEPDGVAASGLDGRGRLLLPAWLRHPGGQCLIAVDLTCSLVVIAPTTVLDGFGDVLAGIRR